MDAVTIVYQEYLISKDVDIMTIVLQECLLSKDALNHRYVRKRALYLSAIAGRLHKLNVGDNILFQYHHGNRYKPLLVLQFQDPGMCFLFRCVTFSCALFLSEST